MRLKNYTNIPNNKIREIIEFVKPKNLLTSNFDVKVTNSSSILKGYFCAPSNKSAGRDTRSVKTVQVSKRPQIVARVTSDERKFPYRSNYKPKFLVQGDNSQIEMQMHMQ